MADYYMGQKVLRLTEMFGKMYFWMEDHDGHQYLTKAKPVDDGYIPDFS